MSRFLSFTRNGRPGWGIETETGIVDLSVREPFPTLREAKAFKSERDNEAALAYIRDQLTMRAGVLRATLVSPSADTYSGGTPRGTLVGDDDDTPEATFTPPHDNDDDDWSAPAPW